MWASPKLKYVGFANAKLPDSDYRIGYVRSTSVAEVHLGLPERPPALPDECFIRVNVGEGLSRRSLVALCGLPRLLRRGAFDIAHFYASQYVLAGPILARLAGVPSIVTVTGTGRVFEGASVRHRVGQAVYRGLFRLSTCLSSAVLFQNPADLEKMRALVSRRAGAKFQLIGSAISPELFPEVPEARSAVDAPRGLPVILMVARVQRAKGVHDFLSAAERLHGKCRFVLIGPSGRGEGRLVQDVRKAASRGVLDYRGGLSDAEVRAAYQECDVVVLPSRTEGLPRVALEATMSWRPVIAYDIPACRAALPESSLVPSFDLEALITRIDKLAADASARSRLADEAHRWVADRFSPARYARELDAVLLRVVAPSLVPQAYEAFTKSKGTK